MKDYDELAGLPLAEVYPYKVREIHPKSVPFGDKSVQFQTHIIRAPEEK